MPYRARPRTLAINGRFLSQPTTGVQRVAAELVREIDHLVASGDFALTPRLYCQRGVRLDGLELEATDVVELGGPGGHFWEQVTLPGAVGDAHLLCLGNSAPLWLLWRGHPVTLMVHDLSYRIYPEAYRGSYRLLHGMMMQTLLTRADMVFTVSNPERDMLQALAPGCRGRVQVVQNGGWRDDDDADPIGASPDMPGRFALYVGSLSKRKNIEGVVSLAIRLWREAGVRSVLAGSVGSTLRSARFDVPEDAREAIRFVGQIEDDGELADLYRSAACLIFPSFYEASPLPPLEAMHFGCPVVVSDIPALRERCGDAAEYCDPSDIDDMMRAVLRVIDDPARAATLRARGHERERLYSWRAQARAILRSITEPAKPRPGPF